VFSVQSKTGWITFTGETAVDGGSGGGGATVTDNTDP